jgi:hypothetical protein
MKRKSLWIGVGLGLAPLLALGALVVMARREPAFYREAAMAEGKERKRLSGEFTAEFVALLTGIIDQHGEGKGKWFGKFTQDQINAYFEEDFERNGNVEKVLPRRVSQPRVAIEPERVRLGFRYGKRPWSVVVTIDVRPWLVPTEPNVMALEIQGIRAGALPISSHGLLESISESALKHNIEVTWYRHKGNPVALLRFQRDRLRPTIQFQRIELSMGELVVRGRCLEAETGRPVAAVAPSEASAAAAQP